MNFPQCPRRRIVALMVSSILSFFMTTMGLGKCKRQEDGLSHPTHEMPARRVGLRNARSGHQAGRTAASACGRCRRARVELRRLHHHLRIHAGRWKQEGCLPRDREPKAAAHALRQRWREDL